MLQGFVTNYSLFALPGTALMVAACEGKDGVVKLLLKAKADFETLDVFGTYSAIYKLCTP